MWSKQGSIEVVDIGNDFFIVRFYSQENLDFALTGGPRKIIDHYLTLCFWKPDLNPNETIVEKIAPWVHLPGKVQREVAHLCIELNITKLLVSQYSINGHRYFIEYEGIHNICFNCGLVGHDRSNHSKLHGLQQPNPKIPSENKGEKEGEKMNRQEGKATGKDNLGINTNDKGKGVIREKGEAYGPWMVVAKTMQGKRTTRMDKGTGSGAN
ncbi:hypothetical protein Ahy_A04g019675 [Arachis hypogaea]|uniref:DUF4283 domain-containing protein n=1 Tax=Arachis hypogaea TaxID=3818 RepID=A0A445DGG9_ARAHY|nr:hypothetical protein Ahy_A04g019675 [Arachis hypogaea]